MYTTATPAFRKTAEMYAQGATTLPQRYFVSPEIFAEEQDAIFSTQWVLVGHQSQVEKAGDFFVQEVAGESLIIARDREQTIRGFYNVCRHRGTRLCDEQTGHSSTIQCPYHAWTYALDGKLIGAPHMDAVNDFAKDDYSLHAVKLALWEGFIFVNLASEPTSPEEVFAPLAGKFPHWNLAKLRSAKRMEYDVRANWKLVFQNYSECNHCPGVHPALQKLTPYDL
ncbi:MAG TPA: aromatic ring-hydroxylating dioxygenase subunit alpha, partial [Chthoniobacterales bacterium]